MKAVSMVGLVALQLADWTRKK